MKTGVVCLCVILFIGAPYSVGAGLRPELLKAEDVACTCAIFCCPVLQHVSLNKRSVSQALFDMAHVRHKRCCDCVDCGTSLWR